MSEDKQSEEKANLQEIIQIMTTEHYNLQSGRSATISDANGRSSLYLSSVSSTLVALAFIGQVSKMGDAFLLFGLVLFPSLIFLGLVTFARVLQTAIEDQTYARGISRIRHYYIEVAPQMKDYFILSSNDDMAGSFQNSGMSPSRWQVFLTNAGMISVINSILAGVFVGLAVNSIVALSIWLYVVCGLLVFGLSVLAHYLYQRASWLRVNKTIQVLFPSNPE